MNKFGISEKHYLWIKKILNVYLPNSKIYIFGSRARGDHKQYSDLDLAIETKQIFSSKIQMEIQEQFSKSDVPFKIEIVELGKIQSDFKASIQDDLKVF